MKDWPRYLSNLEMGYKKSQPKMSMKIEDNISIDLMPSRHFMSARAQVIYSLGGLLSIASKLSRGCHYEISGKGIIYLSTSHGTIAAARRVNSALGVTRAERLEPDYQDEKELNSHEKRPQFGNSLFGAQLL